MSDKIVLKLTPKTARKMSYMMGRSDEANSVAEAAKQAATAAEGRVKEILRFVADESDQQLPERYRVVFDDETNEVSITSLEEQRTNGQEVNHA